MRRTEKLSIAVTPTGEAATLLRLIEYAAAEARFQELTATAEILEQAIEAFNIEWQALSGVRERAADRSMKQGQSNLN
jgi:hypothetical protein